MLLKNPKLNKFSVDTFWLVMAQVILMGSGLILNLLVSFKYGAGTLGVFNQVLSFYLILTTIFSLGLNNSIIQKISSGQERDNAIVFSSNLFLTLIISLPLATIAIGVVYIYPNILSSPEVAHGLFITLFAVPLYNLNKNFMALNTAKRNQKLFSIIRTLRWLLIISFVSISIYYFGYNEGMYYSLVLTEIFLFLLLILINYKFISIQFEKKLIKSNLNFGVKSFTAELFSVFNSKIDILIIGYFLTLKEVGIFSFYIFFIRALFVLPGIMQQNINPIISKHWKQGTFSYLEVKLKVLRKINFLLVFSVTFGISVFYYFLVTFFKTEFYSSLPYFFFNVIFSIPFALISWGGAALVMTGKLRENILRTGLIMIFSIISLLTLTYFLGFVGTSIAVSLNFLIGFLLLYSFVQKTLKIRLI